MQLNRSAADWYATGSRYSEAKFDRIAKEQRKWKGRLPGNGEISTTFGVFKSVCCGREVAVAKGAKFPDCPRHPNLPTIWKPVLSLSTHAQISRFTEEAIRTIGSEEIVDCVTTVHGYQELLQIEPDRKDYEEKLLDALLMLSRQADSNGKVLLAAGIRRLCVEMHRLLKAS